MSVTNNCRYIHNVEKIFTKDNPWYIRNYISINIIYSAVKSYYDLVCLSKVKCLLLKKKIGLYFYSNIQTDIYVYKPILKGNQCENT